MKGEPVYLKPEIYAQLPERAWLNSDKTISVEFAGQRWIVDSGAGTAKTTDVTEEPVLDVYGVSMSLVFIRRLARVVTDRRDELVPVVRYSQCRLPIHSVRQAGTWVKPAPAPLRERFRA